MELEIINELCKIVGVTEVAGFEYGYEKVDCPPSMPVAGCSFFRIGSNNYAICPVEAADEAVESAKYDLKRFIGNAEFLISVCCPDATKSEILGFALGEAGKPAEEVILSLIRKTCGVEAFVDAAVTKLGRGYFLASNGQEIELLGGKYFAYRL